MLRSAIKTVVEQGLILSGLATIKRRQQQGKLLILAYHNIVPAGERALGDQSLHLPQRDFARQLDALCETHDIISLADVLTSLDPTAPGNGTPQGHSGPEGRPRAVITFDDAYCGTMTAGVEELRRRNLPGTVFVTPEFLGGRSFWWDMITPENAAGLPTAVREHALTAMAGKHADVLRWARERQFAVHDLPAYASCATEQQLREALTHTALTLGSHTWSHPNLTRLTPDELAHELSASRTWLRQFGNRALPAISYPYGRADESVWRAAEAAGYAAGLMIDGGWATIVLASQYAIPRLNIPAGVSNAGFILRTSGLIAA